jgi:hypothetical protein
LTGTGHGRLAPDIVGLISILTCCATGVGEASLRIEDIFAKPIDTEHTKAGCNFATEQDKRFGRYTCVEGRLNDG